MSRKLRELGLLKSFERRGCSFIKFSNMVFLKKVRNFGKSGRKEFVKELTSCEI